MGGYLAGSDGNPIGTTTYPKGEKVLTSQELMFKLTGTPTTTSLPLAWADGTAVVFSSNMQTKLVGSLVRILTGTQIGQLVTITAASASGLTVDALSAAPVAGDYVAVSLVATVLTGSMAPQAFRKTVTTAGTRVPLSAASLKLQRVHVAALPTNTKNIYLGDNTVSSSNGYILPPGGESPDLLFMDLSTLYIDADVNGEGVSWIGGQ